MSPTSFSLAGVSNTPVIDAVVMALDGSGVLPSGMFSFTEATTTYWTGSTGYSGIVNTSGATIDLTIAAVASIATSKEANDTTSFSWYVTVSGANTTSATYGIGATSATISVPQGATMTMFLQAVEVMVYGMRFTVAASVMIPLDVLPLGAVALSNVATANYGLSNYFTDPQGSALFYWLSANPHGNAALDHVSGQLSVTGTCRGVSYDVTVSASNAYGVTATDTLSVTEYAPAYEAAPGLYTAANGDYTGTTQTLDKAGNA
jgi:hypothetical protein